MDNIQDNFRKRLLESEHFDSELREKYNKEVHMLFEKKLTAHGKWFLTALIAVTLVQAAFFLYAVITFSDLPCLARVGFGAGILFSLSFAALLFSIAKRGRFNLKTDSNFITGITWVFLVIMITIFMLISGNMHDTAKGISMVLNGLVFLIFGVVFLLQNTITQANLKLQEKLLEIEFRLAEMKEMMKK